MRRLKLYDRDSPGYVHTRIFNTVRQKEKERSKTVYIRRETDKRTENVGERT